MKLTHDQMALAAQGNLAALLAAGWTPSDLRAAGWTPSDLLAAGWTPSALLAAGWTPSDLRAAGWTPSALRAAGWTPSDLLAAGWTPSDLLAAGWTPSALRAAGWTPSDLEEAMAKIPLVSKPYSTLLESIRAGQRVHRQSTFGPDCDPGTNLCKTPMCTAGHIVNMAGDGGYELKNKYGWQGAATLLFERAHPGWPQQSYESIPQEWAMAHIAKMAEKEQMEDGEKE